MDGEAQKESVAWEKATLAPVDRLRSNGADSPTPGLVEGTEPGEIAFTLVPKHTLLTLLSNPASRSV